MPQQDVKPSYPAVLTRRIRQVVLLLTILVALIWLGTDIWRFGRELRQSRARVFQGQGETMRLQVRRALSYLSFQRGIEEDRLRESLQEKVRQAHAVATGLMQGNRDGRSRPAQEEMVRRALSGIRWAGGRGYLFAIDSEGRTCLHPRDPVGRMIRDERDARGKLFVEEMLRVARLEGEGFVRYQWERLPGQTVPYEKLSFVKSLDDLGWVMGAGEYLYDQRLFSQDLVRRHLRSIRYGQSGEGYLFVLDGQGTILVHGEQPALEGMSQWPARDEKGRHLNQAMVTESENHPNGAFLHYAWQGTGRDHPVEKWTFVQRDPVWGWVIGTGCDMPEVLALVSGELRQLRMELLRNILLVLVLLVVFYWGGGWVARRLSVPVTRDVGVFSEFFEHAGARLEPLELDRIAYLEFEHLARQANRMILERRHGERELDRYRKHLEELVAQRTEALHRMNLDLMGEIERGKTISERLASSERRYREVLAAATRIAVMALDPEGRILTFNTGASLLLGYQVEEAEQLESFACFLVPEEGLDSGQDRVTRQEVWAALREGVTRDFPRVGERLLRDRSGREHWVELTLSVMSGNQGEILGYLALAQDIGEKKRAYEELKKLRNMLVNMINAMPSVVVGLDGGGRVVYWNREAELLSGCSAPAALGRKAGALFPQMGTLDEWIMGALSDGQTHLMNRVSCRVEGKDRFLDITVVPLLRDGGEGAVLRMDDVTERARMEEMMIQTEKMLSVGGLAAGMAHEINNPLAGIVQNATVVVNRLQDPLPGNLKVAGDLGVSWDILLDYARKRGIMEMLGHIRNSAVRAARIVENMLGFARKSQDVHEPVRLEDLIRQTLELAQNDYDLKKRYDFRKIDTVLHVEENLPDVCCDATKIQQVLFNLLRNGAEAMMEHAPSSNPRFDIRLVALAEEWVRIEVADNGPGMPESVRKRVFEPFFTTKPVGVGTGLGLSVSYFIITQNHGGRMRVESRPGAGTVFTLELPVNGGVKADV